MGSAGGESFVHHMLRKRAQALRLCQARPSINSVPGCEDLKASLGEVARGIQNQLPTTSAHLLPMVYSYMGANSF